MIKALYRLLGLTQDEPQEHAKAEVETFPVHTNPDVPTTVQRNRAFLGRLRQARERQPERAAELDAQIEIYKAKLLVAGYPE